MNNMKHEALAYTNNVNLEGRKSDDGAVAEQGSVTVEALVDVLRLHLSEIANVPLDNLDPDANITELGLSSIVITELAIRLEPLFGFRDPVVFFAARSIRDAAARIKARNPNLSLHHAKVSPVRISVGEQGAVNTDPPRVSVDDVAIIGLSGRFPQAENVLQFAELLAAGQDCIEATPPDGHRLAGDALHWGGFLSKPMNFDYGRFNMSYRDALLAHPEERLLLQEAWGCLESAGYNPLQWVDGKGADIGVYVGASFHEYSELVSASNQHKGDALPYSSQIFSYANRLSYFFNLTGPSIAVDCACSSSLYAIVDAYNAIRFGLCRMALAGGVNLNLHPSKYDFLNDKNALSQDSRCRAFSEGGTGYVPSEGVGVILLKTLEQAMNDGDNVLAVIKGGAAGNDGRTNGFTVPNPDAQRDIIRKAFAVAQVPAKSVSLVECHGTGTSLGDPIEVAALAEAFNEKGSARCPISSVKSNIGHLEAAAGIAQVTKVILQLNRKQYFPNVMHHENLNPNIDFERTPFKVQTDLAPWPVSESQPVRRAGVSSFGAGGTNVHLILEQAPDLPLTPEPKLDAGLKYIIPFSASTPEQLVDMVSRVYQYIRSGQALTNTTLSVRNIATTLQCGRSVNRYRVALICDNSVEVLLARLKIFLDGHVDSTMISGEQKEPAHSELMGTGVSITELLAVAKNWVVGRVRFRRDPSARRLYLPTYVFQADLVRPVTNKIGNDTVLHDTAATVVESVRENTSQQGSSEKTSLPDNLTLVRDTLKQVLGALPTVFTDDTIFTDLGIDSIMMGRIHTALGKTYPELDMFAFFDFNTCSLLSAHLDSLSPLEIAPVTMAPVKTMPVNATPSVEGKPVKQKDDVGDIGALSFGESIVPFNQYISAYHGWPKAGNRMRIEDVFVNGSRVEYLVCGEGPALLLLPPFNSSAIIWIRQLHRLSKDYKVIVPHYPGFSRSEWIDGLDSFDALSDILVGVIDELVNAGVIPNRKVNCVGWSLGGFIAQTICKNHPKYVRKLVLISTTTVSWSSKEYTISAEDFSLKCAEEFENNFKKLPKFIRNMPAIKTFRKEGHIERFVWCTTNRRILDSYFRMIARFRNAEAAAFVQAPTLLISGADDVLMPAKFARELNDIIPNSVYKEIDKGHHFLSLFHYKTINKMLMQWFGD